MLINQRATTKFYRMSLSVFLFFVLLILLPNIMTPANELVHDYIEKALFLSDKGKLILAVLIQVLVFTLSEMVIFLAAFAFGQKIYFLYGKKQSISIILLTVSFSYLTLILITDYTWNLATPLLITFIYIFALFKMNIFTLKFRYQAIILFQLMLAIQWLEVNPALLDFGFGKSESVQLIIAASYQIEGAHILQLISVLISIPFSITAILTLILIQINMLRNKELAVSKVREQELQEMKISAMESRLNYEMHSLVHDLKTPLTTIRGLISLVELQFQKHNVDPKAYEYMNRIEGSIQQLNEMISEILYENAKREITLQELINYTRANFVEQLEQEVTFTNHHPDVIVYINRIRVVRALINLIQNAADATRNQEDGKIHINICYTKAYAHGNKQYGVLINVTDNGEGISDIHKMKIWDVRYSTKGSSGLGLPFVKKVVNDHYGWIKIESKEKVGTIFTLFLPKESV